MGGHQALSEMEVANGFLETEEEIQEMLSMGYS